MTHTTLAQGRHRGIATTKLEGTEGTDDFKLTYWEGSSQISPWHDIPVAGNVSGSVNMVVEIPRYTLAKMEVRHGGGGMLSNARDHVSSRLVQVDIKAEQNPIVQDTKKGRSQRARLRSC